MLTCEISIAYGSNFQLLLLNKLRFFSRLMTGDIQLGCEDLLFAMLRITILIKWIAWERNEPGHPILLAN
jgi:hypothetical protein